ncbi:ribosomal protein L5 domain-containing protein [Mycotypha africana]|uniref:ribosomal protein L5 domain-containing protein n=1 Tax=Mycotypha africana TaxID=64632 RepID=UPI0023016BEE|nr:ribosomal protein L5 domain-containing protein [Mycotypha africana]KAI8977344.1 ribosomal protein L5 domain-containing protein [Mycotypha africana]
MLTRSLATRCLLTNRPFLQNQLRTYASKKKVVVDPNAVELKEAVSILQALEVGNPQHQIEAHVQCKIEKSTPIIRGSVILPKNLKEEATILVFATGEKAKEAKAAGAQFVGGEELIEQVQAGQLKFDKCISTPEMFPAVTKIARVLGPKGLMPTVKKGTVTDDIANTVRMSKGSFDFKADKKGVLHTGKEREKKALIFDDVLMNSSCISKHYFVLLGIGRVDFSAEDIEANLKVILEELRAFGKTNNLKTILQNVVLSSTRGPGIVIAVFSQPLLRRAFSSSAIAPSSTTAPAAARGLLRLKEYYNSTLSEDLMALTYDHSRIAPPTSKIPDFEAQLNRALEVKTEEDLLPPPPGPPRVERTRTRKGGKPVKPVPPLKTSKIIPRLDKIVLHAMVKEAITNKSHLLSAFMAFQSITGIRPEIVHAKSSVSNWKIRAGMPIGVKVTLRGDEMYEFMDKLVEIVLPRLKEWQGVSMKSGDSNGNLAFGFPPSALALFPEIEGSFDVYPKMTGFDVILCTTAYTNTEGRLLLSALNVPFNERTTNK